MRPARLAGLIGRGLPMPIILDPFDSIAGFTIATQSTGNGVDTTPGKFQGAGRLVTNGTGTAATLTLQKTLTGPYDPAALGVIAQCVDFSPASAAMATSHALTLGRGATTGSVTFSNSGSQYRAGRRWIAADASEFGGSVAALGSGNLIIKSALSQGSPYTAQAYFDAMYANAKGRASFTLSFDDGYRSQLTNALPAAQARGLTGACCYNLPVSFLAGSDLGGPADKFTQASVFALDAAGWEVNCDSTANDSGASTTDMVAAAVSLQVNRDWITNNPVSKRGRDFGCWASNVWNESLCATFEFLSMKLMRTTNPDTIYTRQGFGDIGMTMPAQGTSVAGGTTAASLIAKVDQAILRGAHITFYLHGVYDVSTDGVAASSIHCDYGAVFIPLLDYLKTKKDAGLIDALQPSAHWARDNAATYA